MEYANLHNLYWREPLWLLLALLPPLLLVLEKIWCRQAINAFADAPLLPWVIVKPQREISRRLLSRSTAYLLAWVLFSVALAGPQSIIDQGEQSKQVMDIFVVVDVSTSMTAADIQPTRLQRARKEILELLQHSQGQRIGVIVFAGRPHVFVPLTRDVDALRYYLELLDMLVLPTSGTQVADALQLAVTQLQRQQSEPSQAAQAVILITDGDVASSEKLLSQADNFKANDIGFSILAVGTVEGEAVPAAEGGWLQHQGQAVISRNQEDVLHQLATAAGGQYSVVQEDDSDWKALYKSGIAAGFLPQRPDLDSKQIRWRDWYHWPLLPAIVLFIIATIPYRLSVFGIKHALLSLTVLFTPGYGDLSVAESHSLENRAYQSYLNQDYAAAAQDYAQIIGYRGRLGEGASRYQAHDYSGAIHQFTLATLQANSDQQMTVALYNLGNSYFQFGNYALAVRVYEDTLRYQASHSAAKKNLQVSKALKALVEKRSRRAIASARTGRGPRQASAQEDIEITDSDSVSLGESEDSLDITQMRTLVKDLDATKLEQLIENGLQHVQLVDASQAAAEDIAWKQEVLQARKLMLDITEDRLKVWRRLFEIEEGFPAPLDEPQNLLGVMPW